MEPTGANEKGTATKDLEEKNCELKRRENGHSWSDFNQMAWDRDGCKMVVRDLCIYTLIRV